MNKRPRLDESPITSIGSDSFTSPQSDSVTSIFIVNCAGTTFTTSRQTLQQSNYFSALLSHTFAEGIEASQKQTIYIDRDPEAFRVILSYLRTMDYCCISPKDSHLLGIILTEADFYGLDQLIDQIKIKCFENLYPFLPCNNKAKKSKPDDHNKKMVSFLKYFPTTHDLKNSPFFPDCYWQVINYAEVISISQCECKVVCLDYPKQMFVFDTMITWERKSSRRRFVEPYIRVSSTLPEWQSIPDILDLKPCLLASPVDQLVPLSFHLHWLKSCRRSNELPTWHFENITTQDAKGQYVAEYGNSENESCKKKISFLETHRSDNAKMSLRGIEILERSDGGYGPKDNLKYCDDYSDFLGINEKLSFDDCFPVRASQPVVDLFGNMGPSASCLLTKLLFKELPTNETD